MTALDWVLLAIVAISALLGLMRGFVAVVLSLVAWTLAGAVAYLFGGDAAAVLSDSTDPGMGYVLGGYVLCFGSVLVAVKLLSWFVRRLLESVGLSGLDRGLGLAFGLLRGALFACVLVLLMGFTSLPGDAQWRRSQTIPVFEPGARWLRDMLPTAIAQQVSFEGAGPLAGDALRRQGQALAPLVEGGALLADDQQALLRSLGAQSADNGGVAPTGMPLPVPLPEPGGRGGRSGAPVSVVEDPAAVDGRRVHDPAAIDVPSPGR